MAVSIQELRIDNEFKSCQYQGMVVRCGWMVTDAGRVLFISSIDNRLREVPKHEYTMLVREACKRVDDPTKDNITVHYSRILAHWAV